jgi:protein-S-isoprenylcysteine O-methyltransferase Ste14
MSKILVPPVWFLLGGLGMLALHRGFLSRWSCRSRGTGSGSCPSPWASHLRFAAQLFRRAGTPVAPWETPSALVAVGPYRFTRNPMYLGLALCLSGLAIYLGTLTPFLVIPLFAWVITALFILREEQRLEERFGSRYCAYKARVRRWI